jgi:uncharacterized membrane protein
MPNTNHQRITMLALSATIMSLIVVGRLFHIGFLYVAVGVVSILFAILYTWTRSLQPRPPTKTFWVVLEAGIVFVCGAIYGAVQAWRGGWQWGDLIALLFPLVMGTLLVRFAFKILHKSRVAVDKNEELIKMT